MQIISVNVKKMPLLRQELAACIGYFDGFHVGHQSLFAATLLAAKEKGLQSAVITFDPDPWVVIKGMSSIPHLSSLNDRAGWAKDLSFDYLIVLEFSKEMSDFSPMQFIQKLLLPLSIKHLVCGFDFHFGCRGMGSVETLKRIEEFTIEEIQEVSYLEQKISSSRICREIADGNLELVSVLLGRPYQMHGVVVTGRKQGRTIGFPTANLQLTDLYVMPKRGVYIGKVQVKNAMYLGMINVGHNPTFNYQEQLSIEVHILDFAKSIYGEEITLSLYSYLREEMKFIDIAHLQEELSSNLSAVKAYFKTFL